MRWLHGADGRDALPTATVRSGALQVGEARMTGWDMACVVFLFGLAVACFATIIAVVILAIVQVV